MAEAHRTPPNVLDLLVEVFEDLRDNFVDRLLSGVGFMLVLIPMVFVGMGALYAPVMAGMFLGVAAEDEALTMAGMVVGLVVGFALMILCVTLPILPMYASMGRAVNRQLVEGGDLGFAAPFDTITEDVGKVLGTSLITAVTVLVGMLFCYLPGLVAAFALGFALPAVIVDRLSPVEACKRSVEHVMAEPVWHLGFYVVTMGISMVVSYVPVIGFALVYPILLGFQIRAYRHIFHGDVGQASEPSDQA